MIVHPTRLFELVLFRFPYIGNVEIRFYGDGWKIGGWHSTFCALGNSSVTCPLRIPLRTNHHDCSHLGWREMEHDYNCPWSVGRRKPKGVGERTASEIATIM